MSGSREGDGRGGARGAGGTQDGNKGPANTEFLDLELSQVLYSEAEKMAKQVALDLVREGIRERLRERLGPQLHAVGRLAGDELADDVEANFAIEERIAQRQSRAEDLHARVQSALRTKPAGKKKR